MSLGSLTVGSSWNLNTCFETHFLTHTLLGFAREYLWSNKYLSHSAFSFPTYTQICHNKTMILNWLTIGSLWNYKTTFWTYFCKVSPLGFLKLCYWREKLISHIDSKMEATISSPSLWHLEILVEQWEEKLEVSQGTAITIGLHPWALLEVRDEFIAIGIRIDICKIFGGLN